MKTKTKEKIIQYISENNGATASEIVNKMELQATGIFRHLKSLQKQGIIYKVGNPPKVGYYLKINMNINSDIIKEVIDWAINGNEDLVNTDFFCSTRDVFQTRLDRTPCLLQKYIGTNLSFSITAVCGEIGNNSYDHNLGSWLDKPGVNFITDEVNKIIALADRGQGIMKTISRVRPDIKDHREALKVAFTEIISGRFPERRGNGLKYVKKTIIENSLFLEFYSGDAQAIVDSNGLSLKKSKINIPGSLAIIKF
ncbi:MAG: winged helix-turn-helix domain-containing protein [bacterium]